MNHIAHRPQKASFARLFASPLLYISVGVASLAGVAGCSSSSPAPTSPESCAAGTTVSCACANGEEGTETCGSNSCECASAGSPDAGTSEDAGAEDTGAKPADAGSGEGAGNHDGAAPSSLYGACAVKGGFGWPCTVSNALDPTNCTDPNFPFCFGGGQGFWCTRACTTANFETACNVEDAGCTSSACNGKGYCK